MMPSARPAPPRSAAATATHTFELSRSPSNAGRSTSSVARPRASVSHREANANSTAPVTEVANGSGCMRMYEPINRMPRRKIARSTTCTDGVVACMGPFGNGTRNRSDALDPQSYEVERSESGPAEASRARIRRTEGRRRRAPLRHDRERRVRSRLRWSHFDAHGVNPCPKLHPASGAAMMRLMTDERAWFDRIPVRRAALARALSRRNHCSRCSADAAAGFPDTPALGVLRGATCPTESSCRRSSGCSAVLAGLGVRKGDRVGMILPNCPEYVIAFFAASGSERSRSATTRSTPSASSSTRSTTPAPRS